MDENKQVFRLPGIRTFEAVLPMTGWPTGIDVPPGTQIKMDDLPSNLQDKLYMAMERKSDEVRLALAIAHLRIDVDPDKKEGDAGYVYLHVILSEVVTMDKRSTRH